MSVLITVIVPIYNMEQYLEKCVNSILCQTYSNLEVVLVDDGSSDSSGKICDLYAEKDSRVVVIHKGNGGLSDARNAGLDVMHGLYVTFVDSDDYLETDAIERMYEVTIEAKSKIVCMKNKLVDGQYRVVSNQSKNTGNVVHINSNNYIQGMCEKRYSESVCDKLFETSLFKTRRFEKGRLNEDFFLLSKLLFEDISVSIVDYAGYYYYQRPGSISHSGFGPSLVDAVMNSYELMQLAHNQKPELEQYFARLALFQIRTSLIIMPWKYVSNETKEYITIMYYMKHCKGYLRNVNLCVGDKIFISSVACCPKIVLWIVHNIWRLKAKIKSMKK